MLKKIVVTTFFLVLSTPAVSVNYSYTVFASVTPYVGVGAAVHNAGGYTGLMENAFIGVGKVTGDYHDYYIGGEVFTEFGSIPLSNNQANRATYGIGGSLIPGFLISPVRMIYLRIGAELMHYRTFQTNDLLPQLGIGVQNHLYKRWDVRAELLHSFGDGAADDAARTKDNRVGISLVYNFK